MTKKQTIAGLLIRILPFVVIMVITWWRRDQLLERSYSDREPLDRIQRLAASGREYDAPARKQRDLVRTGRKLSADLVKKFEERAAKGTLSEEGRARLIGYYGSQGWRDKTAKAALGRHIFWFIANRPESAILRDSAVRLFPSHHLPAYVQAKELWLEHLETSPNNLLIRANAAEMLLFGDRELSIDLLKEGEKQDPENGEWAQRLARCYSLRRSSQSLKARQQETLLELEFLERAYRLLPERKGRFVLEKLGRVAYLAGDRERALQYATLMVKPGEGPFYQERLIHCGHTIFGLVALDENDLDTAKAHLLESVTLRDKKFVRLSNPDYRLARRLVGLRELDSVREFIEKLTPYLTMRQDRKGEWLESVEQGLVPNFEGM